MTDRAEKGANSRDFSLMFLGDVNVAPTIADNDALVFDETTEKFVPSAGRTINFGSLKLTDVPTSSDGLSSGDIWSNAGVLTIVA